MVENIYLRSITELGNSAFAEFRNLESVHFSGGSINGMNMNPLGVAIMQRIGNQAFSNCVNLTGFYGAHNNSAWFENLTSIGSHAFEGCSRLEQLRIAIDGTSRISVTAIGANAFLGCSSLDNFRTIPASNEPLMGAVYMLDADGVLMETEFRDGVRVPTRIIKAPVGLSGSYAIPPTVTTISDEAFAFCIDLEYVSLPPGVRTIGARAFAECHELESITIPPSVTSIGNRAFENNSNLATAIFQGNAPGTFGTSVFYGAGTGVAGGFTVIFYPGGTGWSAPVWRGYPSRVSHSFVTINHTSPVSMEIGATALLRATVNPASADQAVVWTVEGVAGNPTVLTVSSPGGVVHAVETGTATIRATSSSGNWAEINVNVTERVVPVSGVLLDSSRLTVNLSDPSPVLTAVVYPSDATQQALTWESSNTNVVYVDTLGLDPNFQRVVVPVAPGTATITVRTMDGNRMATCVVTVTGAPTFVPVSNISLAATSIAMGATIELNSIATVFPLNATNRNIEQWSIIDSLSTVTTSMGASINGTTGRLIVPWDETGVMVVEATIFKGLADATFPHEDPIPYTQRFTLNIVPFVPVTSITGVPSLAYTGVPLELTGSVFPVNAAYRDIVWSIGAVNTARAYIDTATGRLIAHDPGVVRVRATVENGQMINSALGPFTHSFDIRVAPYIANTLTLRADPGGFVSGTGSQGALHGTGNPLTGLFAGSEEITITATPNVGFSFAGWHSTNGGTFANTSATTTQFIMPGNATTVTAYFTYTGLSVGGVGGGMFVQTPVHYFTHSSVYVRYSGISFGHVSMRDYNLFSHVSLNGIPLTRNAHYTVSRISGASEIIFANGYMNTLLPGSHTLTVHFTDHVTISAVFTVVGAVQASLSYQDVRMTDWFFASVNYVTERGWMSARSNEPGFFRPSATVTQGEVIDAFYKMAGSPTILNAHGQTLQGRDAAYEWVRANGILPLGSQYSLNSPISRQNIAVLFSRMVTALRLNYPITRAEPSFADYWQIDPSARTAVSDIFRAGIMSGRTASTFAPLGNMTRAEYAAVLNRFSQTMGRW